MFSDFLPIPIGRTHFADYIPQGTGSSQFTNRLHHGLVINDADAEKEYTFSDGKVLHTTGNSLFYLPQGTDYRVRQLKNSGGCHAINFEFEEKISVPPFMLTLRAAEEVRHIFREAERARRTHPQAAQIHVQKAVCEIILAGYEEEMRTYVPGNRAVQIAPAMTAIADGFYKNDLRISALARLCGMSEVYFRRIFMDLYGKSPKDYIVDLRMERARLLLSDGGFSVGEVAELCGYFEPTHFSREFKRREGISPADYKYGK